MKLTSLATAILLLPIGNASAHTVARDGGLVSALSVPASTGNAQTGNAGRTPGEAGSKTVELSLREGTWMSVDVNPGGDTIAFDLLNDIYVLPAGGGEARVVHGGAAAQRSPQFSPDGRRLLYLSDESGADNLWISNVDGSNARQITHETVHMITDPAWMADGRHVVATKTYDSVLKMRSSEIRRYGIDDGSDEVMVEAPAGGKDVQEPRCSSDGRYLYYTERVGGEHYVYLNTSLANFVIRRRDLRSGETKTWTAGFGSATTAQVSPDNRSIAFIRRLGAKTVLFRQDASTRVQTPVYADLDRDLQADYVPQEHYFPPFGWFPDNRHVAIWGKGKLLKVDMESGEASEIPFHATSRHELKVPLRFRQDAAPPVVNVRVIRQLAPAPRGGTLVFRALGRLWQQDQAGTREPRRLTLSSSAEFEPAWSSDGRRLAYVEWDDENGSTLRVRTRGSNQDVIVARSGGVIRQPVFSRDDQRIAYRIMDADSSMGGFRDSPGLYVVSAKGGDSRFVTEASGVLQFSPDDARIYFLGLPDYYAARAVKLRSVRLDGSDARDHAFAETADTGDFRLSPDQRWIAFKEYNQLHVMPYVERGEPIKITAVANPGARQLTASGGFELAWSADSSRLHWMLGPDLYTAGVSATAPATSKRTIRIAVRTDVPTGTVAFVNARVIPMTGEEVIEKGAVVIVGNRIHAVGAMGDVAVPAAARVIDVSGKTVMPGFFDAHGHIDCCFGTDVMPVKQPTRYAALAYGVTTNFDPYSNELTSYESGEMTLAGQLVGPRWLSSGQVIYGRSGKPDRVFNRLRNLEDAREIVARKAAIGGTILKSYKLPTREQRQWLIAAAREGGMMVDVEGASHFYDNVSALLDGNTNLEHNFPVANYYDDLVKLHAASAVSNTPTLIVTFGELFGENYIYQTQTPWKEAKVKAYIPAVNGEYNPIASSGDAPMYVRGMQSIHYADELYDVGFRSVARSIRRLDEAGVTINVGSHGQAAGIAMSWEMQLLAAGGMKNMRILRAATINGARTYGLEDQLGSLEPGKLADVIVLDRNPLEDIRNTDSVRYTMINGRLYDAQLMDEIGNHPRPRSRFFWESAKLNGVDWNPSWATGGNDK